MLFKSWCVVITLIKCPTQVDINKMVMTIGKASKLCNSGVPTTTNKIAANKSIICETSSLLADEKKNGHTVLMEASLRRLLICVSSPN